MQIVELSQADYARRRNVSPNAIGKAIDAGRIPASAVRRVGRGKLIDVAKADFALGQNILRVNTPAENLPLASAGEIAPTTSPAPAPGVTETPALHKARLQSAEIAAQIAQLDFDKRIGRLLEVTDVAAAMQRWAEAAVREVDQLATHADDLAAAFTRSGVEGVRQLCKEISRRQRGVIEQNMRLLGAEDAEPAVDQAEAFAS